MSRDETGAGVRALDARVETQTLYLMEMMRRLGVSPAAARDEAAHAARADAEALCADCADKAACAAVLAGCAPLAAPPHFCANAPYVEAQRRS